MSETPDILLRIAADRTERMRLKGSDQGLEVPTERQVPLVNFQDVDSKNSGCTARGIC